MHFKRLVSHLALRASTCKAGPFNGPSLVIVVSLWTTAGKWDHFENGFLLVTSEESYT